ncbi:MAG: cytochrome P450 [Deltaproteobacteria bacterium]|nr:cytochrome P450 [Deltaproteobacteria bacterium]
MTTDAVFDSPAVPGVPLPAFVQTLLWAGWPMEFLERAQERYGDVFHIHTLLFGKEVVLAHPEDVKEVFTGDPDQLRAGEANQPLEPLVGPRSVLLLDGPEHLRQRRLLLPPFHGERMLKYAAVMRETTAEDLARWPRGAVFSLHPHMQRVTLDIILRTIFGAEDPRDLTDLRAALSKVLDRLGSAFSTIATIPPLRFHLGGFSPWAIFQREMAAADKLVYARIAKRRAEGPREDVLSLLLSATDEEGKPLTDPELRDELMTLLVAGHETTATMLCWAFDLILSHPAVRDRLVEEVTGAEDPQRLPYLDAVLKEVLRMRPVIPAVGRRLSAPLTLRGRHYPTGTLLVPSSYLVHHNPEVYPDPKVFRPERFLDRKSDPYTFFPFGGGVRRCLGMAFAQFEMKVVLAEVFGRVKLKKARPGPAKVTVRVFTFAPEKGVEVVLEG